MQVQEESQIRPHSLMEMATRIEQAHYAAEEAAEGDNVFMTEANIADKPRVANPMRDYIESPGPVNAGNSSMSEQRPSRRGKSS